MLRKRWAGPGLVLACAVLVAGAACGRSRSTVAARSASTGRAVPNSSTPAAGSAGSAGTAGPGTSASVTGATGAGSTVVSAGHGTFTGRVPTTAAPATSAPPTSSATTATTGPPSPPTGTGVFGTVSAGPTCPVERPDHPCPPRPVSAEVDARQGARTVASTTSDGQGAYRMSLAPGRYTLVVVTNSSFPRCPSVDVTVPSGPPVRADISCDTGIR